MGSSHASVCLIFVAISPLMSIVTFLYPLNKTENFRYNESLKSPIKSKTGFVTGLSVLGMALYCCWLFVDNMFSFPDFSSLNNN